MLLEQLTIQNLLSFGDIPCVVPLRPLNVLIGPNGSGKSNFIEIIELLRATPKEVEAPIRDGGGVREWIWKGSKLEFTDALVSAVILRLRDVPVQHSLTFCLPFNSIYFVREQVQVCGSASSDREDENTVYLYESLGNPVLTTKDGRIELDSSDFDLDRSILAQRRDPGLFPEITYLAEQYERIQIYREWSFGRNTPPRLAQRATDRNDRLLEDFSNLGMMLNKLRRVSETKQKLLEMLNQLYPNIDDFDVIVEGGTVQVFFQEGKFNIPATRLSDGTLRYLCLLAILLQPTPPPLVCIEEPELGLHPDVLPGLADLLREASQRMQLVVTTHSDVLVDALSDNPEDIIICEKRDGQTTMRRLETDALSVWLKDYSLGELWRSGQLGGNRW